MPDFFIQTHKTHAKGKWSNVYTSTAPDLAEIVADMVTVMTTLELPLLHPDVTLESIRFSTVTPFDGIYQIVPIGEAGTSSDTGDLLPFFNCVRIDFVVIGGGRPSRKYWKGLLTETLVTAQNVNSGTLGLIETTFNAAIASANDLGHAFRDNDGQVWDSATALAPVQMRQMHRKRKKRVVTP